MRAKLDILIETDKLLKNNNFRNNQNYVLGRKNILLEKVEYKSKYRNKNFNKTGIEYSYLLKLNGEFFDSYNRMLNIGEFAYIDNTPLKEMTKDIFSLFKNILELILFILKFIYSYLISTKIGRIILKLLILFILFLIYDHIEVYINEIIIAYGYNINFKEALIIYFKNMFFGIIYVMKEFLGGIILLGIFFTILFFYIKVKGIIFRKKLKGKYIFLRENISDYKILVYRYK